MTELNMIFLNRDSVWLNNSIKDTRDRLSGLDRFGHSFIGNWVAYIMVF